MMTPARQFPTPRFIRLLPALLLLEVVVLSGCAANLPSFTWGGWIAGFEQAERTARASNKPMVVFYRTTNVGEHDAMNDALESSAVKSHTEGYVRCCVFQSFEPDRRFMRQYGVNRAPALVLVHPDGTYHAHAGPQSAEQIAQFLETATPPGATPVADPLLPREVTYSWQSSLGEAESAAARTGQSVFVVLDRWLTRDWFRLEPMLDSRDVHSRVADMIHCRPNAGLWSGVDAAQKRFAVANLPALVVLRPDGSFQTLELPTSSDAIARFLGAVRAASVPAAAATNDAD